jgi:outer membrane protein insertion porin family
LFLVILHHRLRSLRAIVSPASLYLLSGICIASCVLAASPVTGSAAASAVRAGSPVFGTWLEPDLAAPQTQQTPVPTQQKPPQNPPQKQPNPFENVPENPQKAPPVTPPTTTPPPGGVTEVKPATIGDNIVEEVQFRGQRKVPQDTLRGLIFTKKGDVYDEDAIHRDFVSLWNSGRFDDLRVEKEKAANGGVLVRFVVTERRTVHTIDYTGNKSISKSEILDRFKERHVNLTPESQYDPGKVQRAKNVLQDYESERGHQYAAVVPQIRQVPPGGVDITFAIDEGPKLKVGNIIIQGNTAFNHREVVRAMKNLKPIGLPHSLLFESLFARTFDSTKLDEDGERIRQFYQSKGYFTARVINHSEKVYDVYGRGLRIPLVNEKKPGKHVDVTMVVAEGNLYTLRNFSFIGMKLFRTPDLIARQVFRMNKGDPFSTEKLQKGLDDLRKLYGNFGYIDFVGSPDPEIVPGSDNQVDLSVDIDEGHQFFVRRIDFQGNNTTRDKVIRREMLVNEGDLYSQQLWDTSVLRLNQLGYFDPLKPEDAATMTRDTKTNTVDLLVKVKERGKNSIQLNGGVSGISGSFIGASYSTNNFLGLGETLSLSAQIGTLLDNVTFGFTEPYLFDKPVQAGFTVFYQRYSYDQGRQASILAGTNLLGYFASLGTQNLLNYVTNGKGFTTFVSYQLRRSFARIGLTYSFSDQSVRPLTDAATSYFDYLDFQGIGGPNSLAGIRASTITPTFAYNTVNHPITPTRGLRVNFGFGVAGTFLGGNVNTLQPNLDVAYFRRGIFKGNVQGFHVNARFIAGFGGRVAPPYSRYYMGGESDIRGFDILTISPIAYIPTSQPIGLYNFDGTARVQKVINADGSVSVTQATQNTPSYQLILPGGDTAGVFNYEYRIPIFGPVTLAPFIDAGIDKLLLPSQLGLNSGRVTQLNQLFPQADFGRRAYIAPGTQVPRVSTGLELQVLMPVVNAPFRLYWAYNPSIVNTTLQPPVVADRSFFPNDATYQNALQFLGVATPYHERHSIFRFSIGRTF